MSSNPFRHPPAQDGFSRAATGRWRCSAAQHERGLHETHPEIVKRLKRAAGHLDSIVAMVDKGRPCLELAQQLQAVESAIANAKKTLVHDHIHHCLERTMNAPAAKSRAAFNELKTITKYL